MPGSVFGPDLVAGGVQARIAQQTGAEPDHARLLQDAEDLRREYRVMLGDKRRDRLFNDEIPAFLAANPKLRALVSEPGFSEAPAALAFMRNLAQHVRKLKHV